MCFKAVIESTIAHRAVVLPTGPEVTSGQMRHTNTPFFAGTICAAGYSVTSGPALPAAVDPRQLALVAALQRSFGQG